MKYLKVLVAAVCRRSILAHDIILDRDVAIKVLEL